MKTIRELALQCEVSEQAIRKWCMRNQVAKDVSQHYIINETTESLILSHYQKKRRNQVAKHSETSCETNETMKELVDMLKKELKQKDKQIDNLSAQLAITTQALQSAQESVKASQLLHANTEQKLKLLEQKQETDQSENNKKHWWNRN